MDKKLRQKVVIPITRLFNVENQMILSDGKARYMTWTLRSLFDSSFEIREILVVGRDTSKQQETTRQLSIQKDLAVELALLTSVDMVLEHSLLAQRFI